MRKLTIKTHPPCVARVQLTSRVKHFQQEAHCKQSRERESEYQFFSSGFLKESRDFTGTDLGKITLKNMDNYSFFYVKTFVSETYAR